MRKQILKALMIAMTVLAVCTLPMRAEAADSNDRAAFDYKYYADTYPDLKAAYGYNEDALWDHYVQFGQFEARKCYVGDPGGSLHVRKVSDSSDSSASESFDYKYYADTYPDLKAAFGYDQNALWNHYVQFGQKEGRKCSATDTGNTSEDTTAQTNTGASYAEQMLAQINAYRQSNGLGTLQFDEKCMAVSALRVTELPTKWSHTRPNETPFYTAFDELGYTRHAAGENLFWQYNSGGIDTGSVVSTAMEGFKNSPGHNANMLRAEWNYCGFGFLIDGTNAYVTQIFADQ